MISSRITAKNQFWFYELVSFEVGTDKVFFGLLTDGFDQKVIDFTSSQELNLHEILGRIIGAINNLEEPSGLIIVSNLVMPLVEVFNKTLEGKVTMVKNDQLANTFNDPVRKILIDKAKGLNLN